jgi:hypothetical protein
MEGIAPAGVRACPLRVAQIHYQRGSFDGHSECLATLEHQQRFSPCSMRLRRIGGASYAPIDAIIAPRLSEVTVR